MAMNIGFLNKQLTYILKYAMIEKVKNFDLKALSISRCAQTIHQYRKKKL
jgi:hypothetical protein